MKRSRRSAPPHYAIVEVRHLLAKPGCPLCHAEAEAIERFLFWFFHESYGEPAVVSQYVQARGFCPEHLKLIAEHGPQWQISAIFSWIIEDMVTVLKTSLPALQDGRQWSLRSWGRQPTKRLQPSASCLLCTVLERTHDNVVPMLLAVLEFDQALRARFAEVGGCCVPHALLIERLATREQQAGLAVLLRVLSEQLQALQHDLAEFFRKADYRYAHEPRGAEQHAWRRALALFGYRSDQIMG